ncbi:unnamed protein product, partial [Effrenium voratum]
MTSHDALLDVSWAAVWIVEACRADDALALSYVNRPMYAELLQPCVWRRYLVGSLSELARPVLADAGTGEVLTGALVHPENYRAIVAALRQPGWFRHYQGLKRLATQGHLSRSFSSAALAELRRDLRAQAIGRQLQA